MKYFTGGRAKFQKGRSDPSAYYAIYSVNLSSVDKRYFFFDFFFLFIHYCYIWVNKLTKQIMKPMNQWDENNGIGSIHL